MAIRISKDKTGYYNGDKAILTGKKDDKTYSFPLYELEYVEGVHKGQKFWQPVESVEFIN